MAHTTVSNCTVANGTMTTDSVATDTVATGTMATSTMAETSTKLVAVVKQIGCHQGEHTPKHEQATVHLE